MATQRQIEANRRNATLSSGPKTESGKQTSRLNATKHGLASESADLEVNHSPAFAARRVAWSARYQPVGEIDEWALDRAVAASFRIERCEQAIETLAGVTAERASLVWDQDRALQAARLGARLAKNPSTNSRKLESSQQGVDLMIEWWSRLEAALQTGEDWTEAQASTALDLLGVPTALRTGRTPIDPPDVEPEAGAEAESSLSFRQDLVAQEIDRLEQMRAEALEPLDQLDREQALSGQLVMIDAPGRLILRYERQAWRHYHDSIKTLVTPKLDDPGLATVPVPVPEIVKPEPAPAPSPVSASVQETEQEKVNREFQKAQEHHERSKKARQSVRPNLDDFRRGVPNYGTNPIDQAAEIIRSMNRVSSRDH